MATDTFDTSSPAGPAARLTPLDALVGVLVRPRHTFERMRDAAHGYWWVVFVLALVVLIISTVATVPIEVEVQQAAFEAQIEQFEDLPPEQLAQIEQTQRIFSSTVVLSVINTATGIVGLLFRYVLRAGLLFLLGLALGGQASFKQVWRMAVWTTLPLVIGSLVSAIAVIATGNLPAAGLTTIFSDAELASVSPVLIALLSRIDLYTLWSLALIAVGMVATARLSLGNGVGIAAAYWLLGVGWAMAIAAIGQALLASFGGGL
ncbi:MAG TPA: YIP1 family protein [Aggregatilineales bacterium]|nr:hypothetical protein [Chloroflexota bacterium]HOA24332.1 YIP1 family protein [Aggregatilineales bacterium]HPV06539.1 YIP1 family protein [Aggregatilineales bacterium]HQA67549.1 YIP1 family protein [Aggregatilineales bacterium]HQE18109.1 YIP1 family protein [Aggregatilineales bacterium]